MKKIVWGLVVLVICLISISAKEVKMDGYYEFKNDDGSLDWNSFYAKIEEIGKQGVFDYICLFSFIANDDMQAIDNVILENLPQKCLYRKFIDGGAWRAMIFYYKQDRKFNLFIYSTMSDMYYTINGKKTDLNSRSNNTDRQKAIEEFKMVLELM